MLQHPLNQSGNRSQLGLQQVIYQRGCLSLRMTAERQYLHRALINVWIKFMMLFLICTALNYMGFV